MRSINWERRGLEFSENITKKEKDKEEEEAAAKQKR